MAHFSRIRAVWNNLTQLLPSELTTLDANQAAAVNGDGGGTWAPTTPINIGGSGMQVTGLQASFAATPTYTAPKTKTRLVNCMSAASGVIASKSPPSWLAQSLVDQEGVQHPHGYVFNAAAGGSQPYAFAVALDDYLENGATLTGATLNWNASNHTALPAYQPFFGIFSVPTVSPVTDASTLLRSLLSTYWATNAAATVAAYNAASQSLIWTPDQNNVIDRTAYTYFAVIADEVGTNAQAGNAYRSLLLTMSVTNVAAA